MKIMVGNQSYFNYRLFETKKSILKLVAQVFLIHVCTFFFFFRTTYQLQLSALGQWGSLPKISPDKPFIISHSRGDNPIYFSSQKGHRLTSKFILLDLSPSRMNRKENDTKSGICADLKDPREKLQSVGACPTLELCCAYKWGFQLLCFILEIT